MPNLIRRAAQGLRDNPVVLLVWLAFLAMAITGAVLWVEDYHSSRIGYTLLPTRKYQEFLVPWVVGAAPQLAQIGFGYYYLENPDKRYLLILTGVAWVTDLVFDVYYRMPEATLEMFGISLFESIVVFTLCSELFLLAGFSMTVLLFPYAMRQLGQILAMLWKVTDVTISFVWDNLLVRLLRVLQRALRSVWGWVMTPRGGGGAEEEEEEDFPQSLASKRYPPSSRLPSPGRSMFSPPRPRDEE